VANYKYQVSSSIREIIINNQPAKTYQASINPNAVIIIKYQSESEAYQANIDMRFGIFRSDMKFTLAKWR
jgi:hypothetical protein